MNPLEERGVVEETSPGKFTAPDLIIKTVAEARKVYESLRSRHLKRMILYKEILGLIAGNPPYNPLELKAAGLQHIANFNDMSPRAKIKRACLAYWNLLHNSQYMVNFEIHTKDPQAAFQAITMAKHWDYCIKKFWPGFNINVATLTAQLVKLGVSPAIFTDERDPRWTVVQLNKFFVPDQSQTDLDKLTTVVVETEFTLQYLWKTYREFAGKSEESSPWNVEQLGKLLAAKSAEPSRDTMSEQDIVERTKKILDGDISYDRMYNDSIRVVSILQQEFSGKISHYMFHRDTLLTQRSELPDEDFLFLKKDQYDSMADALVLFTMDPGEETIHANKGVGHEIFSLAQAKIMMGCSLFDLGKWAATLLVKSPSITTKDVEQIRFYPGVPTNLGQVDLVENTMAANIPAVVSVTNYLDNQMQYNVSYSGSDPAQPDPDQGSLSPVQTKLQASGEFSVLKNNVMHFYGTFDKIIGKMVKVTMASKEGWPMWDMLQEWKKRCVADMVPEEIFANPDLLDAVATRAVGAGSQVAQLMGLEALHQYVGGFGPREQKEFLRHAISATIGPEYIQAFMQDSDDVDETSGGASLAGLENVAMQIGKSPIFSTDNEQRSHMVVHMALGKEMIQQLTQGQADPVSVDKVFSVLIPHGDEHLQALSQNVFAAELFAKVEPLWKQIKNYALLNRKNAEKIVKKQQEDQQRAAEEQQRVMSEEELKSMQVQNEEQRKDVKLTSQLDRQKEMNEAKQDLAERKTQGELGIKRMEAQGNVEIKKIQKGASDVGGNAVEEANANPAQYLSEMSGQTPAPTDFEAP